MQFCKYCNCPGHNNRNCPAKELLNLAKKLPEADDKHYAGYELIWYVQVEGRNLKCLWRKVPQPEGSTSIDLTFVAQWEDTGKICTVFTLLCSE